MAVNEKPRAINVILGGDMDERNQIEEMAKIIYKTKTDVATWERLKNEEDIAEALYSAGYRKQSEGEWVKHELWEHDYICSVCGEYAPEDDYHDCCIRTDYCPNCGARMKGE